METLKALVTSATFRLPGPLAISVAQADAMSGGRVELGIGAGWYEAEHAAYGIAFPPVAERFDRLAEQLEIIAGLWSTPDGARYDHAGRHYRIVDSPALPKPVQRPRPPIIIGGNGPRLLALAAREADTVNLTGVTFTQGGTTLDMSGWKVAGVDERLRVIRDAAGERFGALELSAQVQRVIVTDRPREAAEELQKTWKQLSVEEILAAPFVLIGTVDEMVEALRARRDRWGISYFVTFEPFLDALAPVVARLSGK